MPEESRENSKQLFEKLKDRGLSNPGLIISDAHKGLVAAVGSSLPDADWQRCKVYFMRNVLVHVLHKEK
jgi:putative transposase